MSADSRPPSKQFRRVVLAVLAVVHLSIAPAIDQYTGASELEFQHDVGYLFGQAAILGAFLAIGPGLLLQRASIGCLATAYLAYWSRLALQVWTLAGYLFAGYFAAMLGGGLAALLWGSLGRRFSSHPVHAVRPRRRMRISDALAFMLAFGVLCAFARRLPVDRLLVDPHAYITPFVFSAISSVVGLCFLVPSLSTDKLIGVVACFLTAAWLCVTQPWHHVTTISCGMVLFGSVYLLRLAGVRWSPMAGLYYAHAEVAEV